jgi:hypothetical protein
MWTRRAMISVAAVFALGGGVALAAPYRPGKYEAGAQSGFKHPGVRIDIHKGSFNVERILMHETCTASGHAAIHDFGGFQQSRGTTLQGKITRRGNLSGIYRDGHGNYTKVTGHISPT